MMSAVLLLPMQPEGRWPGPCRSCGMRTGSVDSVRSPGGTRPEGRPMRRGSPTDYRRGKSPRRRQERVTCPVRSSWRSITPAGVSDVTCPVRSSWRSITPAGVSEMMNLSSSLASRASAARQPCLCILEYESDAALLAAAPSVPPLRYRCFWCRRVLLANWVPLRRAARVGAGGGVAGQAGCRFARAASGRARSCP